MGALQAANKLPLLLPRGATAAAAGVQDETAGCTSGTIGVYVQPVGQELESVSLAAANMSSQLGAAAPFGTQLSSIAVTPHHVMPTTVQTSSEPEQAATGVAVPVHVAADPKMMSAVPVHE